MAPYPRRECLAGKSLAHVHVMVVFASKIEDFGDVHVVQLLSRRCMLLKKLTLRRIAVLYWNQCHGDRLRSAFIYAFVDRGSTVAVGLVRGTIILKADTVIFEVFHDFLNGLGSQSRIRSGCVANDSTLNSVSCCSTNLTTAQF